MQAKTIARQEKIGEIIKHLSAKFLEEENNGSSLLTVTDLRMSPDGKYATILFTVFPDEFQKTALEFTKRKRGDFQKYVRKNSKIGHVPFLDFEIDFGEKNRQKIDNLLSQ